MIRASGFRGATMCALACLSLALVAGCPWLALLNTGGSDPNAVSEPNQSGTGGEPNAAPADPHVAGADCGSCHSAEHERWSSTLHAANASAVLLNTEHNSAELLTDECIVCHAPFQAGTFTIADFVQPPDQTGPWHLVTANTDQWQAIRCEVCHDPASSAPNRLAFYDSAQKTYVTVQDSTELCEKCHQPGTDDSRNLKGSVHEGLQCATCHFVKGSEMSLDPRLACAQCHPAANPNHPDVTTLDTTYLSHDSEHDIHFIKCATCHG